MAAPNIVNVKNITAKTTFLTPTTANATVILSNAANSNLVIKVNMITACNIDAGSNTISTSVALNTNAAGTGNSFPIASLIAIPSRATLIVSDKSTAFYLEENEAVTVTSNTASRVSYVVSYEEIS